MCFCYRLLVILLFLFEGVYSSYRCLGKAALFYCGTPLAFHETPLSMGAWERLHYLIVTLPWPSI